MTLSDLRHTSPLTAVSRCRSPPDSTYGDHLCAITREEGRKNRKRSAAIQLPHRRYRDGAANSDDATFNAFAAKVQTDVDSVLNDYESRTAPPCAACSACA